MIHWSLFAGWVAIDMVSGWYQHLKYLKLNDKYNELLAKSVSE